MEWVLFTNVIMKIIKQRKILNEKKISQTCFGKAYTNITTIFILPTNTVNPFPFRSKVKMAMCKQDKTRTACELLAVCSGFMLFAAHLYLRVGNEAFKT